MKPSELALAAGLALAAPGLAHAADPAPVIGAERAFAARAAQVGIPRSFLDFMADDAIVFAPGVTSAKAQYTARLPGKSPAEGGPRLGWWPTFAGLSESGDLGFTTGPAEVNGVRTVHYFTVWRKQPDGAWKWVYDGGVENDAKADPGPDARVTPLPAGLVGKLGGAAAFAQVQAVEAKLAAGARNDLPAAYAAVLAPDARLQGSAAAPATTPAAVRAELATRAHAAAFKPLGGAASAAGDLAWTYGEMRWIKPDGSQDHAGYVRIWQHRTSGWRLVFDQLL